MDKNIELIDQIELKVKEIIKGDKYKSIVEDVKENFTISNSQADIIRTKKLIPRIEFIKGIISKLENERKAINEKISNIDILNSDKEKMNDQSVQSIETNYERLVKIEKEIHMWTSILSDIRLKRALLFSGDFRKMKTPDQISLMNTIKSSEVAKRLIIEETNNFMNNEELKDMMAKIIPTKEDLVKVSNQLISRYAKTDYDLSNIKHILDNASLINALITLIDQPEIKTELDKEGIKLYDENDEYFEVVIKERCHDFRSVFISNRFILNILLSLYDVKEKYKDSDNEVIKKLIEAMEEMDLFEYFNTLKGVCTEDMYQVQEMMSKEKEKEKSLYIKSAMNKSSYLSKLLMLVNSITEHHPKDKDDIEFMRMVAYIEFIMLYNYSIESLNVLITYMV